MGQVGGGSTEDIEEDGFAAVTIEVDGDDTRWWAEHQADGLDVWRAVEDRDDPVDVMGGVSPIDEVPPGGGINGPLVGADGDELPIGVDVRDRLGDLRGFH